MLDWSRIFLGVMNFYQKLKNVWPWFEAHVKGSSLVLRSWQIKASQTASSGPSYRKVSRSNNSFLRMVYEPDVKDQGDRVSQIISHTRPQFSVTNNGNMPINSHSP